MFTIKNQLCCIPFLCCNFLKCLCYELQHINLQVCVHFPNTHTYTCTQCIQLD
uniref:Uncharacterized protein n=1 Tax=Physcomitrium patens TaxID=3218 RepID=A0A2K1J933_PHYPA|nr:hypothetical protein PHYPA_021144 [Physcomitrium patens]